MTIHQNLEIEVPDKLSFESFQKLLSSVEQSYWVRDLTEEAQHAEFWGSQKTPVVAFKASSRHYLPGSLVKIVESPALSRVRKYNVYTFQPSGNTTGELNATEHNRLIRSFADSVLDPLADEGFITPLLSSDRYEVDLVLGNEGTEKLRLLVHLLKSGASRTQVETSMAAFIDAAEAAQYNDFTRLQQWFIEKSGVREDWLNGVLSELFEMWREKKRQN